MKKILWLAMGAMLLLSACSTKKNTAATRFWHSFTARYNTYFNGHQAYLEALQQQEKGNKDNYTELLPVFPISNEATQSIGKSGFETAITKSQKAIQLHSIQKKPQVSAADRRKPRVKQMLQRNEYNPFLKKAWLMMGMAQYHKGEFIEAASTFSYIARHYAAEPAVASEARAWQARCYTQLEWIYDAEDALKRMSRDSMNSRLRREYEASMAELLLSRQQYAEALPYLERTARHAGSSLQKARLWFLSGQVNRLLGRDKEAFKAFQRVVRKNPPFELEFNARIQQTEVLSQSSADRSRMLSRLKRMARNAKYKDYLDQVYFAMGNIHLSQRDTTQAIHAYENGRTKATRSGIEKGVLLLRLGELYWDKRRFDHAQMCYNEAIGIIHKEHEGYAEAMRRSKVLDKLVPYTNAIHLQDSLQALANMSEADRLAAIDRAIDLEKKRQEAERKAKRDSAAQARMEESGLAGNNDMGQQTSARPSPTTQGKDWYFYNPMAVQQGKQEFQKHWGNRKNEDNWRRSNRTVLADIAASEDLSEEQLDSVRRAEAQADSLAEVEAARADSAENNPLKREYYLKQIPFSDEAKAASDLIIMDALHQAGVIEKDDLDDLPLASETLGRIVRQYPEYTQMQDVYYQLFLLYMRWQRPADAERYRSLMATHYPQSDTTRVITHPNYMRNARYGRQIEDSLYAATYDAFRAHDYATVEANKKISDEEFPDGENRPKFIFIDILSRMGTTGNRQLASELRDMVNKYPDSDVSQMAGMLVKGLEAGRKIGDGRYDVGSLWARRSSDASAAGDSARAATALNDDRLTPFVFLIAYPSDSLNDNQLLYELARFNFGTFSLRNFEIEKVGNTGLTQFRITGFRSYDEVHAYAQLIAKDDTLRHFLRATHTYLISQRNLELIGNGVSFDDYAEYFDMKFAPMKIDPSLPLDEGDTPAQRYEDELEPDELEEKAEPAEEEPSGDDGGEWYPG